MKQQFLLFLAAFGLGLAAYALYVLQRLLAKKTKLAPVTVILDFLFCALAFTAFLLLSIYLAYGQFYLFMALGALAGFFAAFAASTILRDLLLKRVEKKKARQEKLKEKLLKATAQNTGQKFKVIKVRKL